MKSKSAITSRTTAFMLVVAASQLAGLAAVWLWAQSAAIELPAPLVPAVLGFGLLIEVIQSQLPHRDFSLADVTADAAGMAIGLLPWPGLRRRAQS